MSKRVQDMQGGGDRYGGGMDHQGGPDSTAEKPRPATAAQMANRKLAQPRRPGSNRSSRATTPTANPFGGGPQQQSMNFQPPNQSGGGFSFSAGGPAANPFANQNGAPSSGTPPPFQFGGAAPTQQNGGSGGMFGNSSTSFGSTFGGSQPPPQQNGFNPSTSSIFSHNNNNANNTTTAGTSFGGFGQSKPQANGISPATNSTSSFPSFGKQQNGGENPFKNFGQSQPSQEQPSTPSTSFGGFGGQQNGTGEKRPSFGGFGGQTNGEKPSLLRSTSQDQQTPKPDMGSLFSFNKGSQENGNKPLFGSTSTSAEAPSNPSTSKIFAPQPNGGQKSAVFGSTPSPAPEADSTAKPDQPSNTSTSNVFGAQPNGQRTGLFGSTPPPPESRSQTPNLGESIFSGMKKPNVSEGMFTQNKETPKPSTSGNLFAGIPQHSSQKEQTPKPADDLFGGPSGTQANGVKSNIFGGGASQAEQQLPEPSTNVFSGFGGSGQPASTQQDKKSLFQFGAQTQQDTSMTTPGNTPQKQAESTGSAPQGSPTKETPAGPGGDLFSHVTPRDPAANAGQRPSSFTPSTTSLFNPPPPSSSAPTLSPSRNPENQTPSARQPPATALKSAPAFDTTQPSAAPWLSHAPAHSSALSAPPKQPPATPLPTPSKTSTTMTDTMSDSEQKTLKVLNDGLQAHLAKQDPNVDWTSVMWYYMQQAAKIRTKPEPKKFNAAAPASKAALAAVPPTPSVQPPTPQKQPPATSTPAPNRNIFGGAAPQQQQQTPKSSGPSDLLQPPRTAPVNKNKRRAEDDVERGPATEKKARSDAPVEYPSLPRNASETSKLFQAAFNKPDSAGEEAGKRLAEKEAREKAERERVEKEKQGSSGGFKPSSAGGFTPASDGMPTFSAPSAGSNSFMAAFGKKASSQEAVDRKKRKDNDYDSDEETEEAWAARDKLEQEAKRKKILADAKKGSGFVISATPSAAVSESGDTDTGSDKESVKGGSLFERVTPREPPAAAKTSGLFSGQTAGGSGMFAAQTPGGSKPTSNVFGTPSAGSNVFGHLSRPDSDKDSVSSKDHERDKAQPEKEAGLGDNTWKPDTPIKFGGSTSNPVESTTPAAPPPVFGNLFGMQKSSNDTAGHLNVPASKPTFGFNFGGQPGSLGTSRASTPGMTTDGEGASTAGEGEDDEPPQEEQVEDQTALLPEEKEHEDVLFQVAVAKGSKWDEKKDAETGEMAPGWVDKCKGPLYILKNKASGRVRVLLKVPPYGTPRMNFHPVRKMSYEAVGKKSTLVQGVFVDHLDAKNPAKLSKWMITLGKGEDAKEIARLLDEEAKRE